MEKDPFKKYLKESEPDKASKGYAWSTAIGLQAVDGLRPSRYLIDTAIQNIEGKITLKEAQNLINSYYEERPVHVSADERTEEADKVSSRIAEILSENAFSFSPNEYISIHHRLFKGIYKHAGKIRDYNITKKEWVLDGASVIYGSASELRSTLEYDFLQERGYSYKGLSMDEIIHHFAVFVSRLWQIRICITKISTFLILCDLAVCLATLYVSFSLVFALMRYLQGKVFLIRFYSPTTLSSSRAEFRLPSRLACA